MAKQINIFKQQAREGKIDADFLRMMGFNERTIAAWTRPIPDIKPKEIKRLLLQGQSQAKIERALGLPARYITELFKSEPGLKEAVMREKSERWIKLMAKRLKPMLEGRAKAGKLARRYGVQTGTVHAWLKKYKALTNL